MNQKLFLLGLASSLASAVAVEAVPAMVPVAVDTISANQLRGTCETDTLLKTPTSLRPLFTDRGGASPVSLGQGYVDVGWMASYSFRNQNFSGMGSSFVDQFAIGLPVVQVGVLNNVDVFLAPPSYVINSELFKGPFGRDFNRATGFDDLTLGGKFSVFAGKDSYGWRPFGKGAVAESISGFVNFPTASHSIIGEDNYIGGLQSDFGYAFPCGWQARMNNGFAVWKDDGSTWNASFRNNLYFHTPAIEPLRTSFYFGFESIVETTVNSRWDGYVNAGLICHATPNFQVFAQTGITVNTGQPEIQFAAGFDYRFHAFGQP